MWFVWLKPFDKFFEKVSNACRIVFSYFCILYLISSSFKHNTSFPCTFAIVINCIWHYGTWYFDFYEFRVYFFCSFLTIKRQTSMVTIPYTKLVSKYRVHHNIIASFTALCLLTFSLFSFFRFSPIHPSIHLFYHFFALFISFSFFLFFFPSFSIQLNASFYVSAFAISQNVYVSIGMKSKRAATMNDTTVSSRFPAPLKNHKLSYWLHRILPLNRGAYFVYIFIENYTIPRICIKSYQQNNRNTTFNDSEWFW